MKIFSFDIAGGKFSLRSCLVSELVVEESFKREFPGLQLSHCAYFMPLKVPLHTLTCVHMPLIGSCFPHGYPLHPPSFTQVIYSLVTRTGGLTERYTDMLTNAHLMN